MNGVEMLLIAVGLAMDAFCRFCGQRINYSRINVKKACIVTGPVFWRLSVNYAPSRLFMWGNRNSVHRAYLSYSVFHSIDSDRFEYAERNNKRNVHHRTPASIAAKVMIPAAIATSIDAFCGRCHICGIESKCSDGCFADWLHCISFFRCGSKNRKYILGDRMEKKAGIKGGLILIAIGVKILVTG